MELFIKNKLASLRGSSAVLNENKEKAFFVKGRVFSMTRKKYIQDINGNMLYKVRNKYWHWFTKSAFVYDKDGNKILKVSNRISLTASFDITGSNDEFSIEGDILGFNYEVIKNGELIGSIKRDINLLVDSFKLTCVKDEDAPFLIALVIAIDNICDDN